jgi:uncharacterized protein
MYFDWDEKKAEANEKKHGISFREAITLFDELTTITFEDPYTRKELRFIAIGYAVTGQMLMVVFCEREGDVIRIISARKATATERKMYEEGI